MTLENLVDDLLRRFFKIFGYVHVSHSSGHESIIGNRRVVFKNPVYVLKIDGIDQLAHFAASVGFTIERKQRKLTDAIRSVRNYGSRRAAQEWLRAYEKQNGRWIWRSDWSNRRVEQEKGVWREVISSTSGTSHPR